MIVEDTDICLNISTEPVARAVKKNAKNRKTEAPVRPVKRAKGSTAGRDEPKGGKRGVASVRQGMLKGRTKQRSLSRIVAGNLKRASVGELQGILRKTSPLVKNTTETVKKTVRIKEEEADEKPGDTEKSESTEKQETSDEIVVAFRKPTKSVGKPVRAKRRTDLATVPRKTLSELFPSGGESRQGNPKLPATPGKPEASQDPREESKRETSGEQRIGKKRKPERKRDKSRPETNAAAVSEDTGTERTRCKPASGKISSLFSHNPEVPNIGQKLVKPINEPVFTGADFADLNIHPFTISNLEQNLGITRTTTVQRKAIPWIFSGRDVLIRSQTGSGKTLAYALPIVELLQRVRPKLSRESGLKGLVVVPTRELALQTYECFLKLVKPFTWIVPGYLCGGEKRKAEKARLRKGCNILVGTPGRLLDHIKHTAALKLYQVQHFVLDEADRMFDMGYEKDISGIVSTLHGVSTTETSDYNPLQLLRRNAKKVFTDDEIQNLETAGPPEKGDSEEPEAKTSETRMEYHSSSEDDTEASEPYVKSRKTELPKEERIVPQPDPIPLNKSGDNIGPQRKQTILLSATLTQAVEKLAGLAMQDPVFVDAAQENVEATGGKMADANEDLVVPQSVVQTYIVTPAKLRLVTLSAYIAGKCQSPGKHKILVFMATQDMVDYHAEILSTVLGEPVDEEDEDSEPLVDAEFFKLHGSMGQRERTDVFKTFREARSGVLLCTDVAARGLDMPKVDCVIQYTGPLSARDYVHRIGRTARAGSPGSATVFLTPAEVEYVRALESRRIRISQEDMDEVLDRLVTPLAAHGTPHRAAIALQDRFERLLLEDKPLREKACKAYVSWVRFYSSYPRDMRQIFDRKQLHLGHFAKSFALRDPPRRIAGLGRTLRENEEVKRQHNNRLSNERLDGASRRNQNDKEPERGAGRRTGLLKKVRMLNISEYDSGLEPLKKPKKF